MFFKLLKLDHVYMRHEVNSNRFFEILNHWEQWVCSHEYFASSACHFSCIDMLIKLIDAIKFQYSKILINLTQM